MGGSGGGGWAWQGRAPLFLFSLLTLEWHVCCIAGAGKTKEKLNQLNQGGGGGSGGGRQIMAGR